MRNRRSSLDLSSSTIVILIVSIALLMLLTAFISNNFGKKEVNLEEILANVPDPQMPSASQPITLSSDKVKTMPGAVEVVKFSVLNPTGEDWIFRDALYGGTCGDDADLICFVDNGDLTGKCNDYQNAVMNDLDCSTVDSQQTLCCKGSNCGDDGVCLVNTDSCTLGIDPDCAPQAGVQLSLACDDTLAVNNFHYNTKLIRAKEHRTFNAIIEIKKDAPPGKHLCQVSVIGINEYNKDMIFEI